ncbi:MAG: 1-deoxy-D-xylulose-5-phosphate reductoisomerase, partial [Holosporales bacterium]
MKTVSIFGATGTVGQKALSLIAGTPGQYRVHTLAAGRDAAGLAAA